MQGAGLIVGVACIASLVLLAGCSTAEAPLVDMRSVPTVIAMAPAQARDALEEAGFKVEFARPRAYCLPSDPLCSGDLDDEALARLDVATQSGTQDTKRPRGSTITLVLGSPVEERTVQ